MLKLRVTVHITSVITCVYMYAYHYSQMLSITYTGTYVRDNIVYICIECLRTTFVYNMYNTYVESIHTRYIANVYTTYIYICIKYVYI